MTVLNLSTNTEQNIIDLALIKGHLNPREQEQQNNCLYADGADRKIIKYDLIDASKIVNNNVRFEDIDTNYCKHELAPLIETHKKLHPNSKGLHYPVFLKQRGTNFEIIAGHNRFWTLINCLRESNIPAFIIEDKGTPTEQLIGAIQANSRRADASRDYKMADVVEQLNKFHNCGHFQNMSNRKKTKKEFEILMNKIHPNQFGSPTTRGKIFKAWFEKKSKVFNSVITWDKHYRNSIYAWAGYPSPYHQSKEIPFPYYVDTNKKIIICTGVDNGRFNGGQLADIMQKWTNDSNYSQTYKGYSLHFVCKTHNVPATIPELNKKRQAQLNYFCEMNNVMVKLPGAPLVTKIIFGRQLKSEKNHLVYDWDTKNKIFK